MRLLVQSVYIHPIRAHPLRSAPIRVLSAAPFGTGHGLAQVRRIKTESISVHPFHPRPSVFYGLHPSEQEADPHG
ncbi:hypothetical protein [Roseiflexus sp.]|uniref:hypothetical protein n=1 Tax=Roseiflexus sp. TaxID=2562120 RepID=UPI0025871B58|nr:hypothetical protein [Roseiflexus sp.]